MFWITKMKTRLGLTLLSGGLDSTTATAWALNEGIEIYALSFDYGQNHNKELDSAHAIANIMNLQHKVIDVSFYKDLAAHSALTNSEKMSIPTGRDTINSSTKIPPTYVPMRNTF